MTKFPERKKLWDEFIEKYKEYFLDDNTKWKETLQEICEYIDKNNKIPSQQDEDIEIKKLGVWICTQKANYKKKL